MKPSQLLLLRSLVYSTPSRLCNSCRTRQFRTLPPLRSQPQAQHVQPTVKASVKPPVPEQTPLDDRSDAEKLTPKLLGAPIGASTVPKPGDNDLKDKRSYSQRKADFTNYDKHLQRRAELTAAVSKPYFRDWKNLRYAKGKAWIANERLWKKGASLYFPNLRGRTLDREADIREGGMRDTTTVLKGRISIVCCFSKTWAENQVKTWISEKENPEVSALIKSSGGRAQIVEFNVEEGRLYRMVLKLFEGNLRRIKGKENWDKYFFLTTIPENVRESIGVVNGKAGYVYLVDTDCKIRWAGSGDASSEEKKALVRGLGKLIEEKKKQFDQRLGFEEHVKTPTASSKASK